MKRVLGGGSGSLFCLFIVFQLLLCRHLIQFNASISVHNTRAQNILLSAIHRPTFPSSHSRWEGKGKSKTSLDWCDGCGGAGASVGRTGIERGERVCPLRGLLWGKGTLHLSSSPWWEWQQGWRGWREWFAFCRERKLNNFVHCNKKWSGIELPKLNFTSGYLNGQ